MNQSEIAQMVLDNSEAIRQGVGRITGPARLGHDVHADLVADATLALLDKRGASYDPSKASGAAFCRMIGYQTALDKLRAMKRGGQFSGAYAGFGNAELDAPAKDAEGQDPRKAHAVVLASPASSSAWVDSALATIAEVLPVLTDSERALYALMMEGLDVEAYATAEGVTVATAYVRANRLRAKLRELLAKAA